MSEFFVNVFFGVFGTEIALDETIPFVAVGGLVGGTVVVGGTLSPMIVPFSKE